MTKRSHHIASRQAAISRERKKKKKAQSLDKRVETSGVPVQDGIEAAPPVISSEVAAKPARSTSTKPSAIAQLNESRYFYLIRDVRKITMIAVPLLVILIILAFVL
jgi:hypothetical protein